MEASDSPVRHRLELLERTVYALQAQQRVLEYRMQYVEDQNKALRQAVSTKEAQEVPGFEKSSLQAFVQPSTPIAPSRQNGHGIDLRSLRLTDVSSKNASIQLSNRALASLSILDEPTLLSTPILTPASKVTIPTNIGKVEANFPTLTPTRSARTQSSLVGSSQEFVSTSGQSISAQTKFTLVASSPEFVSTLSTSKLLPDSPGVAGTKNGVIDATEASAGEKKQGLVPWDGTIAWKFIRLFKDKDEEKQAMLYSMGNCEIKLQDEWIFQYGLRYLPKPDDKDIYRTIRIENLPENTTLDRVLTEVCYGDVFSADLLNTFPITGYHTARVVFIRQQSAMKFSKYAKKKGLKIKGVRASVTLEKTATYPVGLLLEDSIKRHGCTRCVAITVTEDLVGFIEDTLAETYLKDCVETYSKEYPDMLDQETANIKICMRFHSVKAAIFAYKMFRRNSFLRDCVPTYEKDPCSRIPM